ncbi:hypothetical protein PUV54_03130 [Hyphococcus flavus]|uniref:Uncharacterized protein n=1 Tax=Hyphococcus flavus TaxID=1866326 RepID=A0AAE9ZCC5_9PROT|nr:hypothetical protein [Hyphococcus flavus]WDI32184.1 hypothetical protein PUV54_03130 [Hyphococcus flavus]
MLLRRVIEHVKTQNWTAVALDFVIVVVGVFIGIQVSNWNDARGERQRETQILGDIATDIAADIEGYDIAIDGALVRIATMNYIFENTPSAALSALMPDTEQVELHLSWSSDMEESVRLGSQNNEFNFEEYAAAAKESLWSSAVIVGNVERSATASDALVNSGELGILRNKEIVRQLQEYRLITAAIENSQDVTFRPARDAAIEVGQKFGLAAFGAVDEEKFLQLVSAEPELAATLQSQLGWATGHYLMLVAADQSAHRLLQNIRTELGEMPGQTDGVK